MRVLFRYGIILFLACAVFGCSQPIGNISGDIKGIGSGDGLKALPKRTLYKIHQPFLRSEDLTVAAIQAGILYYIPVSQVTIAVVEGDDTTVINELYSFKFKGTKTIIVEYGNLSDKYYVEVDDPAGLSGPGGDSEQGSSIVIKWTCEYCKKASCECHCADCGEEYPCDCLP